jgi:hypothetical protein
MASRENPHKSKKYSRLTVGSKIKPTEHNKKQPIAKASVRQVILSRRNKHRIEHTSASVKAVEERKKVWASSTGIFAKAQFWLIVGPGSFSNTQVIQMINTMQLILQ